MFDDRMHVIMSDIYIYTIVIIVEISSTYLWTLLVSLKLDFTPMCNF